MPPLQLSGVCMLEFLLVFHSDATRASATAILKADLENEAMHKARAIALHDGRIVELWRNQRMLARFARQDNHPDNRQDNRQDNQQDNHPDGDPG